MWSLCCDCLFLGGSTAYLGFILTDKVAESAYQAYNPDNPTKRYRGQTPEHHDEPKMTDENHINDKDDDAIAEKGW